MTSAIGQGEVHDGDLARQRFLLRGPNFSQGIEQYLKKNLNFCKSRPNGNAVPAEPGAKAPWSSGTLPVRLHPGRPGAFVDAASSGAD